MFFDTLEVKIFCNCFLLYPYMKPGNACFNMGQNKLYKRVNNPQNYWLGLQMVLGLSDTFFTKLEEMLFGSVQYTSPPLSIV